MRKLALAVILILFASTVCAWPPIPKAIASGKGIYSSHNKKVDFIWMVGMSFSKYQNVYTLVTIELNQNDLQKMRPSGVEVILYDEGSTVLRTKIDTFGKDSKEIVKMAIEKIVVACPKIVFDLDSAHFGPRP